MDRPKLHIALDTSDWIMEIVGAIFLILMVGLPMYYFNELPDIIPKHFNAVGEPDGFSQKIVIWTLPSIGAVTYIGMLFLNRYPHIFNYPTEITSENAERQYRAATKLIRTLNLLISASFCYIGYSTIQTALNKKEGLGTFFMPVFLLGIFGTIGVYLYFAFKKSR